VFRQGYLGLTEEMVQADYYRAVHNFLAMNFNQRYRLDVLWDTPVDMDHFTTNFTVKPNMTALRWLLFSF